MKINLPDKIFGIDGRIFALFLKPLGLLIIILISIVGVAIPKFKEFGERMKEIKQVTIKTDEVNQKRTYLQTVDQEQIIKDANKLAQALLPEKNSYLLVRIIRNAAAETGYSVDDFSISMGDIKEAETEGKTETSSNEDYDRIPVILTLVGPSQNYLSLVKIIERSLPVMSIDRFEMKSKGDVATIKLSVLAYYLKDVTNLKLENLTLKDLTPSEAEVSLLSTLGEYKNMAIGGEDKSSGEFIKYERNDPFFTL